MFDIVTVGHFAIDLILPPGEVKPRIRLGGPPTYVSLSASKLGSRVSVISRVGGDFPARYVEWLKKRGVDLSGLKICEGSRTTSFLIKYYRDGSRDMFLKGRAPSISVEDLPRSLEAKSIHISPIAGEVSADLIRVSSGITPTVSLDPQGLLRRFDSDGRMSLRRVDSPDFLRYIKVFKSSEREMKVFTGISDIIGALRKVRAYGVDVAIATMGDRGSLISFDDKVFSVPAAKSRVIMDPTGAGDAFIGAFLSEYVNGEDPLWCACVGAAAASFLIERIGPKGFKGRKDVYRRALEIYSKALILNHI